MNKNNKKWISCDIDGILNTYPQCWLDYLSEKCGKRYASVKEAKDNLPDYRRFKDEYRNSRYKATLPIVEENREVINRLAENYRLKMVTSRPIYDKSNYPLLYENTEKWLSDNGINYTKFGYKDKEAKFASLTEEIAFHIDDDPAYAEVVAGLGIKVYLLRNDNWNFSSLRSNKNVIIVEKLDEILVYECHPFFSVCIPCTDRGGTIYNTLKSVSLQTLRDFECIIVDCGSRDNSREEIRKFFSSSIYEANPFPYRYEERVFYPQTVEDWNEPVKLATGEYIAMLEGDDQYMPTHLEQAYAILTKIPNIGVYADGSQLKPRYVEGVIKNKDWLERAKNMIDPAPPSESIFRRTDKDGNEILYDDKSYEYAPECDLYVRIALAGFDLFNAGYRSIYREKSGAKKIITWHYYVDRFTLLYKYRQLFTANEFNTKIRNEIVGALGGVSKRPLNLFSFIFNLTKKTSITAFIIAFTSYSVGFIHRKLFK